MVKPTFAEAMVKGKVAPSAVIQPPFTDWLCSTQSGPSAAPAHAPFPTAACYVSEG